MQFAKECCCCEKSYYVCKMMAKTIYKHLYFSSAILKRFKRKRFEIVNKVKMRCKIFKFYLLWWQL